MTSLPFKFEEAFSRNIGWITREEQQTLRRKRVAIAGLGGAGGVHLLTLTRLGVGAFSLAEFDAFELANFNRQVGATLSSLGRPKLEVMVKLALDINPELDIRTFSDGVTEHNVDQFLDGADLYVDGLDFFALRARILTFDACSRLRVPATTAAPLGMGVSLLNFLPGRMTFEDYFQLANLPEREQYIRFLVGAAPAALQRQYLVDRSALDFANHTAPSTPMGCFLCAGIMGSEALKILLGRGRTYPAPWVLHFDAYRNKFTKTWRPGGNRNPLQRITIAFIRRILADWHTG
jgi:molybdopterin/thiamine biosynthesis adenylyltransferase